MRPTLFAGRYRKRNHSRHRHPRRTFRTLALSIFIIHSRTRPRSRRLWVPAGCVPSAARDRRFLRHPDPGGTVAVPIDSYASGMRNPQTICRVSPRDAGSMVPLRFPVEALQKGFVLAAFRIPSSTRRRRRHFHRRGGTASIRHGISPLFGTRHCAAPWDRSRLL